MHTSEVGLTGAAAAYSAYMPTAQCRLHTSTFWLQIYPHMLQHSSLQVAKGQTCCFSRSISCDLLSRILRADCLLISCLRLFLSSSVIGPLRFVPALPSSPSLCSSDCTAPMLQHYWACPKFRSCIMWTWPWEKMCMQWMMGETIKTRNTKPGTALSEVLHTSACSSISTDGFDWVLVDPPFGNPAKDWLSCKPSWRSLL